MGIKVKSRKYTNFFDTDEHTNWLLGNVGDYQDITLHIESEIAFIPSQQTPILLLEKGSILKLANGKSWNEYGFDVEMNLTIKYDERERNTDGSFGAITSKTLIRTIALISFDELELNQAISLDQDPQILPINLGIKEYLNVEIYSTNEPQAVEIDYTHLTNENFDTTSLDSLIDGSKTTLFAKGLEQSNQVQMEKKGLQSGMSIVSGSITKTGDSTPDLNARWNQAGGNRFGFSWGFGQSQPKGRILNVQEVIDGGGHSQSVGTTDINILGNGNPQNFSHPFNPANPNPFFLNWWGGTETRTLKVNLWHLYLDQNLGTTKNLTIFLAEYTLIGNTYVYQRRGRVNTFSIGYKSGGELQDLSKKEYFTTELTLKRNTQYVLYFEARTNVSYNQYQFLIFGNNITNGYGLSAYLYDSKNFVPTARKKNYLINLRYFLGHQYNDFDELAERKMPEELFGGGSLTDNFEVRMMPIWNNPNIKISNDLKKTSRLGNTGWFNENMNGLKNNFEVDSIVYKDVNGNVVQGLDYSKETVLEAVIRNDVEGFNGEKFSAVFQLAPENEELYKNNDYSYHQNTRLSTIAIPREIDENIVITGDGFGIEDERIVMTTAGVPFIQSIDSNSVKLTIKFLPNVDFGFMMDNREDKNFVLFAKLGRVDTKINYSNRVSLLLDVSVMTKNIEIQGERNVDFRFIEHPYNLQAGGSENLDGFIEDDVLTRTAFTISETEKLVSLEYGYLVENTEIGSKYELETSVFQINDLVVNGKQIIDIEENRGYRDMNVKNILKIETKDDNYNAYFGQKMRWEDWIERQNVPAEFYNTEDLNNGLHNNWYKYQSDKHQLKHFVRFRIFENGETLYYQNEFPISLRDYNSNDNIETEVNYFRHQDGSSLNDTPDSSGNPTGIILSNEPTRIEIIYTNLDTDFDFSKLYAITSIEVYNGSGEFDIRQLSSVFDSDVDCPLIPIENESRLKLELIASNKVKAICLVEPSLLSDDSDFKITGRIGCWSGDASNDTGIYDINYSDQYE